MHDNLATPEIQNLVKNYRAPMAAVTLVQSMPIALIAGIVAAGKDSLLKKLTETGHYARIITTISRAPRPHEIDGVNYYFISPDQARDNLIQQKYFEAKLVHGRVYGTSTAELERIQAAHKIALADVDVQGVDEYHAAAGDNLTAIFVVPPDFATWQARWRGRGDTTDTAEIARRTNSALMELRHALNQGYYHFLINDDLDRAAGAADEIFRGQIGLHHDQAAREVAQRLHDEIAHELNENFI
jgi:guanylate kinase